MIDEEEKEKYKEKLKKFAIDNWECVFTSRKKTRSNRFQEPPSRHDEDVLTKIGDDLITEIDGEKYSEWKIETKILGYRAEIHYRFPEKTVMEINKVNIKDHLPYHISDYVKEIEFYLISPFLFC